MYLKYNVHTLSVCYFLNHKFRSIMHCSIYMVCLRTFRNCSTCIMIILLWNLWTRRFFVNQTSDIVTSCPRSVSFHPIFLIKHTPHLREIINIEGNPGSNPKFRHFCLYWKVRLSGNEAKLAKRFSNLVICFLWSRIHERKFRWGFWA